jgi:hypothetical protein
MFWDAAPPCDFILARSMPVIAALFPVTENRGFPIIYENLP